MSEPVNLRPEQPTALSVHEPNISSRSGRRCADRSSRDRWRLEVQRLREPARGRRRRRPSRRRRLVRWLLARLWQAIARAAFDWLLALVGVWAAAMARPVLLHILVETVPVIFDH